MLNKKSAFKPKAKAAIRRPAPASSSQNSQRPSPADALSKTPVGAPQEPSSSSQLQSAPHSVPDTPVDVGTPVSRVSSDGPSKDAEATTREPLQEKIAVAESAPQGTTSSSPAVVTEEGDRSSVPTTSPPQDSVPLNAPVINTGDGAKRPPESQTAPASTSPAASAPLQTSPDNTPLTDAASTAQPSSTPPTAAPTPSTTQNASATTSTPKAPVSTEDAANEQPQPTTEATFAPVPEPSEAAKTKRARKRKTDATAGEESCEQSSAAAPKKRTQIRAAALPGEEGYQPGQTTTRTTRGQKRSRSATANEGAEEDGEGNTAQSKRKPARPQREATPEDAENVEIDVTQVKMADLVKDLRVGKKFSLHDELMERERAKRLRYNERRKRQQNGEADEDAAGGETPVGTPASNLNSSTQDTPTESAADETPAGTSQAAPIGEQYQIIDGEIVLDHRSLQVDRHARAREAAGELVEVEENDFTHHTTSATYLRRNLKPQQWSDEETDLFYQALSAFGTDFDTICRMFKTKTRKHIKLKFNREERVNPQRINAALVGEKAVAMNMDEYQRHTGQEYESAEAIYAEQKRAEDEFEARQKALEDEKADEVRRKKEELLARLNSSVEGENAGGEGGKKGGRKGRKKKTNFVGL